VFETMGVTEFLLAEKISNKNSQAVTKCIHVTAVDKGIVTRSS